MMKIIITSSSVFFIVLLSSCVNYNHILEKSIQESNIPEAIECLAYGADVNYRYQFGITPLMVAVGRNDLAMVKFLIKNGAVVDAQSMLGSTALMIAAEKGNPEILLYLLSIGADITIQDNQKSNALVMVCGSRGKESVEVIDILIKHGLNVNSCNNFASALYYAISNGKYETIKSLLEKDANPNIRCTSGTAPLSLALAIGDNKIIDLLVNYGAKISEEIEAADAKARSVDSADGAVGEGEVTGNE
jgi:ankyrin repeat protein